ncbi:hypothetical protein N9W39_03250 [Alphaproteobacteria bacterium]|nr:hypothetical protein [Alphaproteobacteria bacterium]MDA8624886.1 hypothetical protein [Alphaproteobacteria bacterium]MDA8667197.1 hypothetical protein [Alphaproteobacteria bacterium]MDA9590899.1 hypothetical protein [Alphaproteobacteria bacterium]MDB2381585.1 hypothetical protein [Alphaproteobacteria bacterium]
MARRKKPPPLCGDYRSAAGANAPVSSVHLVLLELELAGRLTQEPGRKISLI